MRQRPIQAILFATLMTAALPSHCLGIGECDVTASTLPFGNYNPASGSPLTTTGTITVSCGVSIFVLPSWTITLSMGNGTYVARRMVSGLNNLSYNIFRNAGLTEVWGNGSGGTFAIQDAALLVLGTYQKAYTMYGRIPALQDVAPGSYTDTITVTINY